MEHILFLGNGINRVNNNSSWEELLKELTKDTEPKLSTDEINSKIKLKPFPLLYEENIMLYDNLSKENEILKKIKLKLQEFKSNELHKLYLEHFTNIITTNYDYLLEQSLNPDQSNTFKSETKETIYSLFRKISVGNKTIWHIHGELNNTRSICLGYERYGANIQKIRNFITQGHENKKIKPLKLRLDHHQNLGVSWVDLFFTATIYIVGLSLDYQEIDLWWLLNYRIRRIKDKGNNHLNLTNKIYFYDPKIEEETVKERFHLLEKFGVQVIQFEVNSNSESDKINSKSDQSNSGYKAYYQKVLEDIVGKIRKS